MTTNSPQQDFSALSPDCVLDAVESLGYVSDARILALNSYENRVFQIGLENELPLVAKFYRPGRWSKAQIDEEHTFCKELAEAELPVVAPLEISNPETGTSQSLFDFRGFRFTLFPRCGGHPPELDNPDHLYQIGLQLGRIHSIGRRACFNHRLTLSIEAWGYNSIGFLLENNWIPADLLPAYESLTRDVLTLCESIVQSTGKTDSFRLHGDCHPGNILFRDGEPRFVDFDDAINGPAIQDIWMLLSGSRENRQLQLSEILEAYSQFSDFNLRELPLIEVLRTLRIIHHSAWLARRWDDPAFPPAFPWFGNGRFWPEHILALREQYAALQEAPLSPA